MTVQLGATFKAQRKLRRAQRRQHPRPARRPHFKVSVVIVWMAIVLATSLWYDYRYGLGAPNGWLGLPGVALGSLLGGGMSGLFIEQALYLWRVRRWPQTEAKVVRHWMMWKYSEEDGSPTGVYYLPVLWFRTSDGTEMIVIGRSAPQRRWQRGSEVLIHYDSQNPQNVEIPSLLGFEWFSAFLGILFGLGAATGLTYFFTWASAHGVL